MKRLIFSQLSCLLINGLYIGHITAELNRFFEDNNNERLHFQHGFEEFLQQIYTEKPYKSIYLQRQEAEYCISTQPFNLTQPILISQGQTSFYIKGNYNSDFLGILCLQELTDKAALASLALTLQHMRDTRIIVLVAVSLEYAEDNAIATFMKSCQELQLLNVIMISRQTFQSGHYFSYTQFPKFKIEQRYWSSKNSNNSEVEAIFPYRLRNMHGKVLLTLPDQIEPKTILYTDRKGVQKMSGYIGKLAHTFAEYYNCTLQFPYNISNNFVIYITDLRKAARNQTIDFGTSIAAAQLGMNIHENTYPIEITKWLTMLPVEQTITIRLVMLVITTGILLILIIEGLLVGMILLLSKFSAEQYKPFSLWHYMLDSYLDGTVLRGLLGMSFPMLKQLYPVVRLIYIVFFIAGMSLSIASGTQMVTFFTTPPTEKPITNFQDALTRGTRIMIGEEEIPHLIFFVGEAFWERYKTVFKVVKNFEEYQNHRSTMDTTYAYTITTSVWPIISKQQKYYERKLFRLSTELYFTNSIHSGFPVNENSIYKVPFNEFIMRVHDNGLMIHWFAMTFYEMVALKRISLKDLSEVRKHAPLTLDDTCFVWLLYALLMSTGLVIFICEVFCYKNEKKF